MNTEDYVSYPIALALKKHGFNWKCHYGYSVKMRLEPELSFGEPKMVHSKTPKNYNDNRKGIAKGLEFCSAVPLWQAHKWLRDKKHYYVALIYFDKYTWSTIVYDMDNDNKYKVINCLYSSYEEALSAGITECLKLIKLV